MRWRFPAASSSASASRAPWPSNMQQAARVSDHTAFFYEGTLVEFGVTETLFTRPGEKRTEEYITGRFG